MSTKLLMQIDSSFAHCIDVTSDVIKNLITGLYFMYNFLKSNTSLFKISTLVMTIKQILISGFFRI